MKNELIYFIVAAVAVIGVIVLLSQKRNTIRPMITLLLKEGIYIQVVTEEEVRIYVVRGWRGNIPYHLHL